MTTSPKKILYLAPSSAHGGAETFLIHTASFHRPGFDPVYLCFRQGPLVEQLKARGRRTEVLPDAPRLRNPLSLWRAIRSICRVVRAEKIDLIHSTMAYGALFGGLAAALTRRRHVWFQHGPVGSWLDRLAGYLPARAILVNSDFTASSQQRISPRRKLQRIHLGVDTELARSRTGRDAWRAAWGISADTFLVGTVCRPQPQKGLADFVNAVASCAEKNGKIAGVIIGGAEVPGAYEREIQALIEKLGAPVHFVTANSKVLEQIPALDLLVSSAVSPEAFGLTLVESMALGVPTLAPNEGGPKEIIAVGKTGFLFAPRDVAALAKAITEIRSLSDNARTELGMAARKAVEMNFSASKSVAELERCYSEI